MSDPNDDCKNDRYEFIDRCVDLNVRDASEPRRFAIIDHGGKRRGKSATAAILAATYSALQRRSEEVGTIALVGATEDQKEMLPDRCITVWLDEHHLVKVEAVPVKSSREPKEKRPWVEMKRKKKCPRKQ